MKRVVRVLLAGWFLLMPGWWIPSAMADDPVVESATVEHVEEPAVLNSPLNVWQELKAAVDIINPQGEALYRFEKGQWDAGIAGSLWDILSKDYHLGRAKLGYGLSNYGYLGADIDLAGIYGRFAGGKLPAVDKIASLWSKYATTGVHGGRDFEAEDWDYGFTIGASIPWPVGP